jgi:hypothetical protein
MQMSLDAAGVEALQNDQPPTDWSKFDQRITPTEYGRGMWAGDSKLHARFFVLARIDIAESNAANRPIYKDVPYIEIMIPGDKHNTVVEPVWEQHMQRFPELWAQFKRGEEQQVKGTPLKAAPFLTPSHVAELNHLKIMTVEQLADLSDSALNFLGAQEFKQAAKRYLAITGSNEALLARIQQLEAQIHEPREVAPPAAPPPPLDDERPRKNFGK